ncbi:MAG: septum formation initiator family protein [bacterium]
MKSGFLKSKTYLILVLGLIALLAYANLEAYKKNNNKKLNLLKTEAQEEREFNNKLADLKEYFADDIYLERQAREKFKMQKPNEKVIMIQESELLIKNQNSERDNAPNILKWCYYFFER